MDDHGTSADMSLDDATITARHRYSVVGAGGLEMLGHKMNDASENTRIGQSSRWRRFAEPRRPGVTARRRAISRRLRAVMAWKGVRPMVKARAPAAILLSENNDVREARKCTSSKHADSSARLYAKRPLEAAVNSDAKAPAVFIMELADLAILVAPL